MTDKQQPDALRLADFLETADVTEADKAMRESAAELRRLHALAAGQAVAPGMAAQTLHCEEQPDGTIIPVDPSEMAPRRGVAYAALPSTCAEAFRSDFCPYRGSPDPWVVWQAAWQSALRASHGQAPAGIAPVESLAEWALRATPEEFNAAH